MGVNMSSIAIITARGGSKRIPKKNIKEFCGKPIIAYSIEAALKSNVFDEVMVSTDSYEIADIAKQYGASVPFMRSEKTSSDYATTNDVLNEVIDEYKKIGKEFEYMACIYPTAPFVTAQKIEEAYNRLSKEKLDIIMPVVDFSFPPQRCQIINDEGFLAYKFPEFMFTRSQDLEKWYHDAGQFYFYNVRRYIELNGVFKKVTPLKVSALEVQDIDSETDWKIAEIKYRLMYGEI